MSYSELKAFLVDKMKNKWETTQTLILYNKAFYA